MRATGSKLDMVNAVVKSEIEARCARDEWYPKLRTSESKHSLFIPAATPIQHGGRFFQMPMVQMEAGVGRSVPASSYANGILANDSFVCRLASGCWMRGTEIPARGIRKNCHSRRSKSQTAKSRGDSPNVSIVQFQEFRNSKQRRL